MEENNTPEGWKIVENAFHPEYNKITEDLLAIGNGHIFQKANFEEKFTGETAQGNFMTGIHNSFCDKELNLDNTGELINTANWIGIDVRIGAEILDLNNARIINFTRELDMDSGHLYRSFEAELPSGKRLNVETSRFLSMASPEIGAIKFSVTACNFSDKIVLIPYIDFDIRNEVARETGNLWNEVSISVKPGEGYITAEVCKSLIQVCTGMKIKLLRNNQEFNYAADVENRNKFISNIISFMVNDGETITLEKFVVNVSSANYPDSDLLEIAREKLNEAYRKGFEQIEAENGKAWHAKWRSTDNLKVENSISPKMIRYQNFQYHQSNPEKRAARKSELPEWLS